MNADPNPEKAVFLEAVERHAPDQWPNFLDRACAGQPDLRGRVEALLAAHREVGTVADRELPERPDTGRVGTALEQPIREQPGAVIGPYKLLESIGEGGMGVVYLAEQTQPVRRKAALKVIKPGMDTRQVIARFEAERQALALMDHPNIARVLDAGATDTGRPYFVMELVKGLPITRYCDEQRLSVRERLELFVPVCQAVQHAHQKGVIHRDLKPSNVLVAPYDGVPIVKVIDFGVAKAVGQPLTERTLVTGIGAVVGTLEYMSPEQAELNNLDVDTRSDIYSLGVLLYELLTGTTPLPKRRLSEIAFGDVLRIIREDEPPRPSTRLSTTEELPSIAANRGAEPGKLPGMVRGELDWIVMSALEKDRSRRYETANGLALDVQRYLSDEPVKACPPSVGYRLRKFVRRNWSLVLAAFLVVLALVAGLAGTTWGMVQANRERRNALSAQFAEARRAAGERRAKEEAQKRLAQIEKGAEILASVFRELDPVAAESEGESLRVLLGRRLGEAARQLEGEAVGDPLVVARLQHVLGVSLRELGHLELAEGVLVKADRTRERLLGAGHLETVATRHHLAVLYRDQGKYGPAEAQLKQVVATRSAGLRADHPETLASQHELARVYRSQGRYAEAEALFQEVLAGRTAGLGRDHPDTLTSQHRLAALYHAQGKYAPAEALFQEVLAIRTAKLGADHLDTVATKQHLAGLYLNQGKDAPAEALFQEVLAARTAKLGADHLDTVATKQHLAALYRGQGKYAPAEALFQEVLAARTAKLGADHPDTLASKIELAMLYGWQRKYAPAEALLQEVLAVAIAKSRADYRLALIHSYHELAMLYSSLKPDRSIPLFEETLRLRRATFDPDHPVTLAVQADLGVDYCRAGRFADAIPLLEEVYGKARAQPQLELAWVGNPLLTAYAGAGKTIEATALTTERVQAARQKFPADSPWLGVALADTGKALLDGQAYAAAGPLLRESLALGEKLAPNAWDTHHARSLLGGVLLGQQKYAAAEPLLLDGYEGLRRTQAGIVRHVRDMTLRGALERLVQLYDVWGKPDEAANWRKELEKAKE